MLQKSIHPEFIYEKGTSSSKGCVWHWGGTSRLKGSRKEILIVSGSFCLVKPWLWRTWVTSVALCACPILSIVVSELCPLAHSSKTCTGWFLLTNTQQELILEQQRFGGEFYPLPLLPALHRPVPPGQRCHRAQVGGSGEQRAVPRPLIVILPVSPRSLCSPKVSPRSVLER